MNIKIKNRLFLSILLCSLVIVPIGSILATQYSDSFDSNPYAGSWVNELGSAVWDSTNGELDISNDNDIAIRYTPSTGSIEHEAQVTALVVSAERLAGPGVRFDSTGQNDAYGMSFEGGAVNIYRWNNGARSHIASVSAGVTAVVGNYYSMRMSASGGNGSSVVLNVWIQGHGNTKPSDPGWVGNDGSPNIIYTDSSSSGTRLDGVQNTGTGIAGRASVNLNDNRHDYFKSRAISDRGGATPPVTPPTPPSDTTPPTVSSISVSNITTTGATVSWTTNESATSQLQYGLTTSYGSTVSSGGTTSHTVTLSNLTPNTTYNYRVSATDTSNNNTLSTNQTFTTNAVVVTPPEPTTPPVTPPVTPPSGTPTPTGSGKYLYVSPTGNDSVTYANNNASNPWRTIGRATWGSTNRSAPNSNEAARAGDVVLIGGGTYDSSEIVNGRFGSVYNPVNQGIIGNYITFACTGDCVLTAPNANSPIIGASGRSYIKWYADVSQGNSWVINACGMQSGCANGTVNTTPDTGPVVCHDGTGCHIEGAVIDGTTPVDYTDNWNGIRVENAPNTVLRNNTIRNFRTQSGSRNASGITLYGSANTLVENNQISNVAGGIYFKHNSGGSLPMTNVRARYNNISNAGQCVSWSIGVGSNHFYQNICTDSSFGALITGNGLLNDWIFNNTFSNLSGGGMYLSPNGTGGRFWNNICVNCTTAIISEGGPMPAENVIDFEHNVYRGYNNFYSGVGGSQTFATFKSMYPAFEQSTPASVDADPMFISSVNFRLQAGSPARTLGLDLFDLDNDGSTTDIIPAGAYITGNEVIGLNTGGTVTPPPPVTPPSDTTPPTVSITSPTGTVSGSSVTISATATDNTAVAGVTFRVNGTTQGTEDTTSPYAITWNTTTLANGTYTLSAVARDASGNTTTSSNVSVTVNNTVTPPPTPLPTTFTNNQRVQTTANLNVRATANGTLLGNQPTASLGTIVGTGVTVSGTNWWNVNYDSGIDGWSSEQFLQSYTAPVTPPSTPTTTPTTPTTPPTNTGGGGAAPAPTTPTTPTNPGSGVIGTPTTPSQPATGTIPPSTNTGGAGGVATPPTTPTTNIPKPVITRTVYIGSKGSDVTSLQTFLINTGYLASNLNTGYYGPATKQAVQKYQCTTLQLCSGSESTNGYGVVGAKTRATFSSTTTPTPTTTSTLTTEQRAAIQKQIDALLVLVQQLLVQLQAQGN